MANLKKVYVIYYYTNSLGDLFSSVVDVFFSQEEADNRFNEEKKYALNKFPDYKIITDNMSVLYLKDLTTSKFYKLIQTNFMINTDESKPNLDTDKKETSSETVEDIVKYNKKNPYNYSNYMNLVFRLNNKKRNYYTYTDFAKDYPKKYKEITANAVSNLNPVKQNKVEHPEHYTWLKEVAGIEPLQITRHFDFDLGNALKYIMRAGHKSEEGMTDNQKQIEDLQKAIFYLNDKINILKTNNNHA